MGRTKKQIETDEAYKFVLELKAEIIRMQKQIDDLKKKNEELWLSNKIQMAKIVEYRRIIEHYEDGAPMYVSTVN